METTIAMLIPRLAGTTINPQSLLSTDYFNHFNEPIMLLSMLPDMPEMLDEVESWEFCTYCEHFSRSGLAFASLAIEAYALAPQLLRESFDKVAVQMRLLIVETRERLRSLLGEGNLQAFCHVAAEHSLQLQVMVDSGGAIVHGHQASADQNAIDAMF